MSDDRALLFQTTVRRYTYATQAKQIEQNRRREDKRADSIQTMKHRKCLDSLTDMEARSADKRAIRMAIESQHELEFEESILRVKLTNFKIFLE